SELTCSTHLTHTSPPPNQAIPSFPTRRSSDLRRTAPRHGLQALASANERNRSQAALRHDEERYRARSPRADHPFDHFFRALRMIDRKSTRLNSSHQIISYAVFCLKKKYAVVLY